MLSASPAPVLENLFSASAFVADVSFPLLRSAQNEDGGWGFRPKSSCATEPTALALCALSSDSDPESAIALRRGIEWLREHQSPDGYWPARPGQPLGCWVTSLACTALFYFVGDDPSVRRGLQWLCEIKPAEAGISWLLRTRIFKTNSAIQQDASLCGWNWFPGTASWVEPTAHALIAFNFIPQHLHPKDARERLEIAERMLFDRMCPGGGWNSGNPMVYGVGGLPRIGPTCLALLALRRHSTRGEIQESLAWLRAQISGIRGPLSLSLAHLCLSAFGEEQPSFEAELSRLYAANAFFDNVSSLAWAAIAMNENNPWARVLSSRVEE